MRLIDRARLRLGGLLRRAPAYQPATPAGPLLFVCQGRQDYRHGMGRGLYATEPAFRDAVRRGAQYIEDHWVDGVLDLFERDMPPLHNRNEEARSIAAHGLLHVGLIELWRSKGVEPDGAVGLSLGEITSAFAAGMLSIEDTMAVMGTAGLLDERVMARGRLIVVFVGRERAERLCVESPADLGIFAEFGPTSSIMFCPSGEFDACIAHFEASGIGYHVQKGDFGYHTPRFRAMRELMLADLAHLQPKPSRVPFYSAMKGGLAHDWSRADGAYWYWMMAQPVWFNTAAEAALADGYRVALHIGPAPSIAGYVDEAARKLSVPLETIATLRADASEIESFGQAFDRIRELGLTRTPDKISLQIQGDWPATLDFEAQSRNPFPTISQLRAIGPVHHLPLNNYWLVIGAKEVREALADPERFTSEPAQGIDPVLLAAGPKAHARPHKLLGAALASRIDTAETETATAARELLAGLESTGQIDLVGEFAVPLSHRMAGALLGLDARQLAQVQEITRSDLHGLSYVPALNNFFREEDGFPFHRLLIDTDGLSRDDAAHLLTLCWVAGTTTVGILMASVAQVLLYDTVARLELRECPELLSNLLEETMRLESPEQTVWRRTSVAVELGGERIPEGAEVRLHLGAANRDPALGGAPDLFNLSNPLDHIGFGAGLHQCIGSGLARTTARIATSTLLDHAPEMAPVLPLNRLDMIHSSHFRGITSLPARLA